MTKGKLTKKELCDFIDNIPLDFSKTEVTRVKVEIEFKTPAGFYCTYEDLFKREE